ncbi:hypothetical protein BOC36_08665 [Burkholderia pseudomallei]|uniref:hypothetical protein n=1 Tax=Burkholderia pseudomallei TaxID=28450 RepID=UPI000A1A1172|nr:hypothetical protein [Burkholderia pseudomallei]ARK53197.1 hypothetical protein BOC36_08665 [Burkholderia pseudomallei]
MEFERLFEGKPWPATTERIGVMSVDSLNREWEFVAEELGYLAAKSKDGKAALLGRMCKRDDGKFCVEVMVRAKIENNKPCRYEFWHIDRADEPRPVWRLHEVLLPRQQVPAGRCQRM